MIKSDFDKLSNKEKGEIVFLKGGKFIGHRSYYNQKLVLYDLGEFFAEVWYDPETNQISKITSLLPDSKEIERYIDSNI